MSSKFHRTLKSLGLRRKSSPKQKKPSPTQVLRQNILNSYAERGVTPMPGTVDKKIRDIQRSQRLNLRQQIFDERNRNISRAVDRDTAQAMIRERDIELAMAFPDLAHINIANQYPVVMSFGGSKKVSPRAQEASRVAQAIAEQGRDVRERLYGTPLRRSRSQEDRFRKREADLARFRFKNNNYNKVNKTLSLIEAKLNRLGITKKSMAKRRTKKSVVRKSVRRPKRRL